MGRGAGKCLRSDHWAAFYDFLLPCSEGEYDPTQHLQFELPPKSFVFASRQSDVFLFFVADGASDDPPIFAWYDEYKYERAYESFWDFFEEMVAYYEFYLDSTKFSQGRRVD